MHTWTWIPIVLFAALAQTARNAAQREISEQAGPVGATLTRFLYGLPFSLLFLFAVASTTRSPLAAPTFTVTYFFWLLLGAAAQIAGTAFLLLAMRKRNFVVAVTYSKTEVVQVAVLGFAFLGDELSAVAVLAIAIVIAGVSLLSVQVAGPRREFTAWVGSAAVYGVGAGLMLAIATVGYRGAGLELLQGGGVGSPWLVGAWGVVLAQSFQALVLVVWLSVRERSALLSVLRAWRVSMAAGVAGAAASIAWFTGFALQTAAHVRTLGMVEVLFSYAISRGFLLEKVTTTEKIGLVLVVLGAILSSVSL